ncbi:hypothetical protein HNR46_000385 [Haloferula luteola]|uniref:Uncharacterized protein n=1 Tax=Haloferula luteola TaxID=595692 RepID=A0A840V3C9_9BACT|nr:hypothetical protein [Haloferula luteola]MBB5350164.1 hypothetical protein [Haloferula luteola]
MPEPHIPPRLFEDFEAERITREQLHAAMAWHAETLLVEVEEAVDDPVATWWETMLAKRAAARFCHRHGERRVRHVLLALSRIPGYPHARFLWNAAHPDVPLHCFFRVRRAPLFRPLELKNRQGMLRITLDRGDSDGQLVRETFLLEHSPQGLIAHPAPAGPSTH